MRITFNHADRFYRVAGRERSGPHAANAHRRCAIPVPKYLQRLFDYAGKNERARVHIVLRTVVLVAAGCLAGILIHPAFFAAAFLGVSGQYLVLQRQCFQRAESFERDYPAFLLSLASSIRTGLDPLTAFFQCGEMFHPDSVMFLEAKGASRRIEAGASEEAMVLEFGKTVTHPDIALFRTAFILSRREGSSLGECLQRLARVTRSRQSFRRKIRSAIAMQKLSAFGIVGTALAIGVIQATSNPRSVRQAMNHPMGSLALSAGVVLILLGLGWMLFLARRRI